MSIKTDIDDVTKARLNLSIFEKVMKAEYKEHHTLQRRVTPNGRYSLAREAAHYFEALFSEINVDAVNVDWCLQSERVMFNNLYSFTLACGCNIPYCDWVYEDRFEHGECIYKTLRNERYRYEVIPTPINIKFDLMEKKTKRWKA